MEDVAFNEWPGQALDGTNSWLPAYGFQRPSGGLEKEDFLGNPDAEYFLHKEGDSFHFLETIYEETSDELLSDSDVSDARGSPLGWRATDSETDSVICIDATNDSDCESDRELACPTKRRRHEPPDVSPYQSLSRSSSLIQFETLEKQCQETSSSTPSIYSQFSLDSLNPPPKTDVEGTTRSCSSLRTWRSYDNLAKKKEIISAENLSEDSGFGDQKTQKSFVAYDCESFTPMCGKFGASCQNLSTVGHECLISKSLISADECQAKFSSASEPNLVRQKESCVEAVISVPKNLDLISKEDVRKNSIAEKNWDLANFKEEMSNFKREGSYAEAMRNRVDLSDDESSLCFKKQVPKTTIAEFDRKVLQAISESIHSINSVSVADANLSDIYSSGIKKEREFSVVSTPNLVMNQQETERLVDLFLESERRRSVQDLPRKTSLVNHSTSTSCMSDEEKTLNEGGSSKGVHFSPVVSEVNWPEQSSSSTAGRGSSFSSLSSTPERESIEKLTRALLNLPSEPPLQQRPLPESRRVFPPNAFVSYDEPGLPPQVRCLGGSQPDLRRGRGSMPNSPPNLPHAVSQPDVRLKRRGSQLIKKDQDGCTIKAYVDRDGVQYKHTHLDAEEGGTVPPRSGHVVRPEKSSSTSAVVGMEVPRKEVKQQTKKKLGGFFSRLASFRFKKEDKNKKNKKDADKTAAPLVPIQRVASPSDYIYIPLKDPLATPSKPPLPRAPPRVVGTCAKSPASQQQRRHHSAAETRRRTIDSVALPRPMEPMGLIETDLDTEVTVISNNNNVKTRSLLNLGAEPRCGAEGEGENRPHKSMEFLLDKENLRVVEPPENELQKTDRVMSEHQLRVQRSLQKLTVPEWYRQAQVPREGFLLKKPSPGRWQGTASKTTSLSSLGAPSPLSPTSPFVRWSTSKLNSAASSPCASTRSSFAGTRANGSTSPASVRSSFSCRQPYMGWRSQERLSKPRTPAERLANSLLQDRDSEIQTSIKEVTSAIVHYVTGLRPDDDVSQRSSSPRGSQKLCWLESSFVGIRPPDSPQTPVTLANHQTAPSLRLELQSHDVTLLNASTGPKPSPGSTTLEDVLDSLLGLPSSERAASPSLQVTASASSSPNHVDSRRSSGDGERLQCRYARCSRIVAASGPEAANFKSCHNCSYTYCSRACRRAHWEKHRKTCLFSRIGSLCRHIIANIKEDKESLYHLSVMARRGYLSQGPGAVKCFFPCPEKGEKYLQGDTADLGELTYIRWPDLLPSEMGPQLYSELVAMCKSYNPDTRLILYVSVCVVSETPSSGSVKWERQLVSRCAKMRLSKDVIVPDTNRDSPETIVLTCARALLDQGPRLREVSVANVQKQLKLRGVSLKRQYPVIFRQLCEFAKNEFDWSPITIYPKDVNTGKNFMCIVMLGADEGSLRQVESAGVKIKTIDVLND